jgi:hypothetical protein
MEDKTQGNTAANQDAEGKGFTCHDWREERWAWRREMREHRHRFPFHGLFFGLGLVLLGVLFLLNQTGAITGDTWWQALLIGLGSISIVDGLVRYNYPEFRYGIYGKIVCGVILILIGILLLVGFSEWWPVVLIVAGVAFLFRFTWRRLSVSS